MRVLEKEPQKDVNMTFLYTVARNLFFDEKRKRSELLVEGYDDHRGTRDFTEWDSAMEVLYSTLPLRQAMLITLKDVFLYSSKEIAQMLRISNESVKTALHRARLKLQERAPEKDLKKECKLFTANGRTYFFRKKCATT